MLKDGWSYIGKKLRLLMGADPSLGRKIVRGIIENKDKPFIVESNGKKYTISKVG